MKKILTLLFIGLLSFSVNAQDQKESKADSNAPVFKFETEVIDYGKIAHNSDGKRVFKFKNVGKSPLIIKDIKSSCGCAIPKRPTEPIMPGDSGEIEVRYATNRIGGFARAITVISNATEKQKSLRIKGIVLKPGSVVEKNKSAVSN